MPTVIDLIAAGEERRRDAERRVSTASRAAKNLINLAAADGRPNLNAAEDAQVEQHLADKRAAADDVKRIDGELAGLRKLAAEDAEAERASRITYPTAAASMRAGSAATRTVHVGRESRVYRRDQDPAGVGFLNDVTRSFLFADPGAQERLQRHMAEERVERAEYMTRAVGTSAFSGLTVPQYLTDLYAPATAALRPFADAACNVHPLPPDGMTVNISKITTSSSAALQATENAAVSETNMDDTLLQVSVQTAAGQQSVSRQAIERGTGIDDVTMQDLFDRVQTTIDSTLINQATTGLTNVAASIAYTDASPTAAEMWPKISSAASTVEATLVNRGFASHVVMHSRRWNWLTSQVGSSWPFITSGGLPAQSGGLVLTNEYGPAVRGRLSNGLLVVVDNNISTALGAGTEDEIYVVPQRECHLWEDPNAPMFIRAEQPLAGSLGVLLVAYSYFGYTFSRYGSGAMAKIAGTGLAAPVF